MEAPWQAAAENAKDHSQVRRVDLQTNGQDMGNPLTQPGNDMEERVRRLIEELAPDSDLQLSERDRARVLSRVIVVIAQLPTYRDHGQAQEEILAALRKSGSPAAPRGRTRHVHLSPRGNAVRRGGRPGAEQRHSALAGPERRVPGQPPAAGMNCLN